MAFDSAEYIVRTMMRAAPEADSIILDMNRVSFVSDSAARLLHEVRRLLFGQGVALVFSRIRGRSAIEGALRRTLAEDDHSYLSFEDNDVAAEWCENRLLELEGDKSAGRDQVVRVSDLCRDRGHDYRRAAKTHAVGRLCGRGHDRIRRATRRRSGLLHTGR